MARATWGWTEHHTAVAVLLTVACGSTLVGLLDGGWVPLAVAVAAIVTGLVALLLDAWGGAVVGLAAVGALVATRRAGSAWTREDFVPAAVEALGLLLTGAVAGAVASRLRDRPGATVPLSPWRAVHGSLGLLDADAAMARLEEECARSARHGHPVTLALLEVVVTAPDLSAEALSSVERSVARLVESRAREQDVPFALSADRFGIVFPESGSDAAWDVVGDIVQATDTATFTHGERRAPRPVTQVAWVCAGIAQHGSGRDTWQTMLDAAAQSVALARGEHTQEGPVST